MHHATLKKKFDWAGQGALKPGSYALEDHNAAEFLWHTRGFGEAHLCHMPYEYPKHLPEDGDRILVVRVGGFGDTLWLNAIYEQLDYGVIIDHSCFKRYQPVVSPRVRKVIDYPFPTKLFNRYDAVYWLENIIEGKPCLAGEHPADRIAKLFGIKKLKKRNHVHVPEKLKEWAVEKYPWEKGRPRICIQDESSTPSKSYFRMLDLLRALLAKKYEVVVVGAPRKIQGVPDGVIDGRNEGWNVMESIAVASTCDAIIAPDSFMVHVADALGKPCIGLFGNFHGATYMKGYRGEAIQGVDKCSPCSWHPRGQPFPNFCPSKDRGYCLALAKRSPELIITKLESHL
jgi:hypothetical protein